MAKKRDKALEPTPAVAPEAAVAVLDPPAGEEAIKVELPEEFPKAGLEVGTEVTPVEAVPEVTAAAVAPPPKMVRKEALDEERGKRRRLYAEVQSLRQRFDQEEHRKAAEVTTKAREVKDYNQMADLNELVSTVRAEMQEDFGQQIGRVRMESITAKVTLSQEIMRSRLKDFDQVLGDAGVLEAVKIDAATGKAKDPFLWNLIYLSENPALTAYEYAKGKLEEGEEVSEVEIEERGAQRGRKEIVTRVIDNASKPRGIATMPSSTAAEGGMTRRQIDAMTDEQKAWIKKNRSDVWTWYLAG